MKIQLSDHFTASRLIRFVLPSVVMMIFTSIYSVVDGLFVSNYVGKVPFAALNLIMPLLIVMGTIGFMIGTGGSALVAKTLGEGDRERANRYFSLLVYTAVVGGAVLSIIGIAFARPLAILFGADDEMLEYCVIYARIILTALVPFILQNVFQSFLITAEKPKFGLVITISAGLTNIVLDFLLVGVLSLGLEGAAAATAISQTVGGIVPLIYFCRKNDSLLRLGKTKLELRVLWRTCSNGFSEFMTNISASIVTILYNRQLMEIAGQDGVAAFGVIMYVNFIFVAIFIGFSIGSAPIVSFHYGAKNEQELQGLLKKSLIIIGTTGIALTALAQTLAYPLSMLFVGYDEELFRLTLRGFRLYSISFIVCGFNIYSSSFFTSLNNGIVSAMISFSRTFVFQVSMLFILPLFLKSDGIWLAIVAAELLGLMVTIFFILTQQKRYGYLPKRRAAGK